MSDARNPVNGPRTSGSPQGGAAPLSGVRVIESGTSRSGAFAGAILADLGAEVIKVEAARDRANSAARESAPEQNNVATNSMRLAYDRNKRSVRLDLEQQRGAKLLLQLVASADVLLEEFSDGELRRRLGLETGALAREAPQLVHCRVTSLGAESDVEGAIPTEFTDLYIQAISGNMDLTGELGGPPYELGIPLGDLAAGIYAAIGILGALNNEDTTRVEVARLDAAIALLSYMGVGYFADGVSPTRVGTGHSTIFPYNSFRANDGEVVVAPFTQRFWRNFCAAVGREDLLDVDAYKDFAGRLRHKDELVEIFDEAMTHKDVDDWVEIFREYDVPAGPVLTVGEALTHEQTLERGMAPDVVLDGDRVGVPGSPFRLSFADGSSFAPAIRRPPARGEDTEQLLTSLSLGPEIS